MRKIFAFVLLLVSCHTLFAGNGSGRQESLYKGGSKHPVSVESGFVNFTDLNFAFGLGGTDNSYSKYFAGATNVAGYRFRTQFLAGIGIGLLAFDAGVQIPLYLDGRIFLNKSEQGSFLYGDAGFFFPAGGSESKTRLFANPGYGYRFPLSVERSINLSIGVLAQRENETGTRDSFINFKVGLEFH